MSKSNELLEGLVDKVFTTEIWLAARELWSVTEVTGMSRPTKLSYEEKANKVAVMAKKVEWPIATAEMESVEDEIRVKKVSTMSLLSANEVEVMLAKKQKEMPIQQAIAVLARGVDPDVSTAIESFRAGNEIPELISRDDLLKILTADQNGMARLAAALPMAIDNYQNRHNGVLNVHYRDFLESSPIGAEKVVRALRLVVTLAKQERESLLAMLSPERTASPCLRGALEDSRKDYDAARKIVGKMCLTGAFFPVLLTQAEKIYSDVFNHPTFICD